MLRPPGALYSRELVAGGGEVEGAILSQDTGFRRKSAMYFFVIFSRFGITKLL